MLAGKLAAKRADCAPLAGKSTLNRLEHTAKREAAKYHKIDCDGARLAALFVELFLDAHKRPPKEIVLDLDATDDPIHGNQEGRFFHGYYDGYCYLPLYIFCGRFLRASRRCWRPRPGKQSDCARRPARRPGCSRTSLTGQRRPGAGRELCPKVGDGDFRRRV